MSASTPAYACCRFTLLLIFKCKGCLGRALTDGWRRRAARCSILGFRPTTSEACAWYMLFWVGTCCYWRLREFWADRSRESVAMTFRAAFLRGGGADVPSARTHPPPAEVQRPGAFLHRENHARAQQLTAFSTGTPRTASSSWTTSGSSMKHSRSSRRSATSTSCTPCPRTCTSTSGHWAR